MRTDTEKAELSSPESPVPEFKRNQSNLAPESPLGLPQGPHEGIGTKPTTMREVLLDRSSKEEIREQKEQKLQESLAEAQNAIRLVQQGHDDMPLTVEFAKSLMNDFMLRNRVVRQAIVYQVLTFLGMGIKVYQSESYNERFAPQLIATPAGPILRVGIIGGGVMGKTIFEAINKKVIRGR